jgi:thymidine kinase
MAKLYFRYGAVGSAKTLNLVAVAHNYRQQGKKVILVKPAFDTRFGERVIRSRSGLEVEADILVNEKSSLNYQEFKDTHCVLVDEAQFLSCKLVEQLRDLSLDLGIPVICYGLRSDFRGELFVGSKRLFELADAVEEVKSTCAFCNKKATMNLKHINGVPSIEGASVELGGEEKFLPACFTCYRDALHKSDDRSIAQRRVANLG